MFPFLGHKPALGGRECAVVYHAGPVRVGNNHRHSPFPGSYAESGRPEFDVKVIFPNFRHIALKISSRIFESPYELHVLRTGCSSIRSYNKRESQDTGDSAKETSK